MNKRKACTSKEETSPLTNDVSSVDEPEEYPGPSGHTTMLQDSTDQESLENCCVDDPVQDDDEVELGDIAFEPALSSCCTTSVDDSEKCADDEAFEYEESDDEIDIDTTDPTENPEEHERRTKSEVCPSCHKSLTGKGAVSYFVVVPVLYQLQNLFKASALNLKGCFNGSVLYSQKTSSPLPSLELHVAKSLFWRFSF
ncbi:hypothetical protein OS493_038017 [Desmophyllum pertusum]|uniref:Uncharacterized protein n=1 Tax=Desmophyllum pertusum TaxID=174260 RepID=A0A9X0CCJ6_9CNID|nr:hypothetical protein OS493_038017 [Desmophyllum pertusum]